LVLICEVSLALGQLFAGCSRVGGERNVHFSLKRGVKIRKHYENFIMGSVTTNSEGNPVFKFVWKIAGEKTLASSCLSFRPRGTTQLPLEGFLRNLIFEHFLKICQGLSHFISLKSVFI
jgi:hypothetical protein